MNQTIKIVGFVVVIGLVAAISLAVFQFLPTRPGAEMEHFVVGLNFDRAKTIAKLKEQGYIRSEQAFGWAFRIEGAKTEIAPGGYEISKGMNALKLADTLLAGPTQKWAVLPEGLRKEEVAERVGQTLNWTESEKQEFVSLAEEGYLFPDTYLLNVGSRPEAAAQKMKNTFNEKLAGLLAKAQEKNIRNDTLIVLASLVQREAGNPAEMPLIASVIWNRWMAKMPFQIDATIQYVLGKAGDWWPKITSEDYRVFSPYNTYLNQGRPPGPIANPGTAAVRAVIDAPNTKYFYYLHDREGQIHLAETFEEHKINIARYLK